jgi:hypothetical protein
VEEGEGKVKKREIETILIEAKEAGQGVYTPGAWVYNSTYAGKIIVSSLDRIKTPLSCSRPRCHGGGYDFRGIVDEMARNGDTEREGSIPCHGNEASPKGKRKDKSCLNTLTYKITLTFRQEEANDSTILEQ